MFRKLARLFKGNRRLHRERENVLRVKLRTDQLRAARTRFVMQVFTVIFGALGSAIGVAPVFWVIALMLGAGAFYNRSGNDPTKVENEPPSNRETP